MKRLIKFITMSSQERYLSKSKDMVDLEHRLKVLENPNLNGWV